MKLGKTQAGNLKDWEIKDLCVRLNIPEAGQQRIERIRTSEPSRRVRSNGRNVCARFPSRKMGVIIQAESHTVELPYVYQLEHDGSVLEYYDQPESIKLNYSSNGRNLGVIHTPDYFVISRDFAGYTECKTEEELERLAEKAPGRYFRDDSGQWRCPPGEKAAAEFGLSYRVWSAMEVNWTLISNMVFLDDYLREDCPEVEGIQRSKIIEILELNKIMTLHDLVTSDGVSADSVYKLIVDEDIYCNIEVERLSESLYTNVYLNRTYATAYGELNKSEINTVLYEKSAIKYIAGEKVLWDGVQWEIVNVGMNQITLISQEGNSVSFKMADIQRMISEGVLIASSSKNEDALDKQRLSIITSASQKELDIALERLNVILPIINEEIRIEDVDGYPERSIFRWLSYYREAQRELGQGYLGLIPRQNKKGNYSQRLPDEAEEVMVNVIETHYENNKQKTMKMAYDQLKLKCSKRGVVCPSMKTFRKRIKAMPKQEQVKKREGKRAASNLEAHYWRLDQNTPRHGERPFEIAHIDHTELDIELISRETGINLGRPWLTLMVDTFTRRIIAFYLTFDPPSYKSCMMVLRECVRRNEQLPQTIIVDNGKEFGSKSFETLVASYEVIKKSRPPAKSRFGAVCERLFGTTNKELLYGLAGNTQITKKVRIMTKSVNPKNLALWNIIDLTYLLEEFLYGIYDMDVHPALHDSPRNAFMKGRELYGDRKHMQVLYTEDFRIRTLPSTPKGTAKVNFTRGIQINYIRYWHDSFRDPGVAGTNVNIKYDPEDAGIAYACVNKRWVQCVSDYRNVFKNRTWKEIMAVTSELRQKNKSTRKTKDINAHRIAVLLESCESKETILEEQKRNSEIYQADNSKPEIKLVEKDSAVGVINNNESLDSYENQNEVTIMEDF